MSEIKSCLSTNGGNINANNMQCTCAIVMLFRDLSGNRLKIILKVTTPSVAKSFLNYT